MSTRRLIPSGVAEVVMVRHAELVRVNQHLIRGRGYVSWVSFAWKGFCSETLALYIYQKIIT